MPFFEAQGSEVYLFLIFKLLSNISLNHSPLSPIIGSDVTVGILPRKAVFCRDFILLAVASLK